MPAWLQGVLALAGFAVVVSQIVARWGGRAQRQDTDGRTIDEASRAVQRHEVTDATMAQTIATIAGGVARMESRLDRLAEGHAESREARVRTDAEVSALREADVRTDARLDAIDARITRVDEAHTAARHALREEIQRWVSMGITDALEILRTMTDREAPRAGPRAPRGK